MGAPEVDLHAGTQIELTSLRTRRKVVCTVDKLLGTGGTAKVYSGVLDDGNQVVLKAQRFAGQIDPGFEVEIELFKKLFHRNIVHCVGVGTTNTKYLVIGFRRAYQNPLLLMMQGDVADGMRRDHKARYASVPLDTAIDFGYELLNALDYLERLGIVHHDVKLANILVDIAPKSRPLEGNEVFGAVVRRAYRGVLIDFGATRSRSYLDAWNKGEAPPGLAPQITPLYAPPESLVETRQADGKLRVTFHPSLDVYAAALVLYALVTGHPPYSHLKTPINMHDLESVIGAKSAERRAEIEPISADVLRRVVLEDTKFVNGDRASFDLAFYRFLAQRLHADPEQRGTASDMKRDFEKLCYIRSKRAESGDHVNRRSQVFLPFEQELVVVGGRGEHPLYRAARLCGVDLSVKPTEVTPIGATTSAASAASAASTTSTSSTTSTTSATPTTATPTAHGASATAAPPATSGAPATSSTPAGSGDERSASSTGSSSDSSLDWLDEMEATGGGAPTATPPVRAGNLIDRMDATPASPARDRGRKTRRHDKQALLESARRRADDSRARRRDESGVRRDESGVRRGESGVRRGDSQRHRPPGSGSSDRVGKISDRAPRQPDGPPRGRPPQGDSSGRARPGSGVRPPKSFSTRATPGQGPAGEPPVPRPQGHSPYERPLPPRDQAEAPHVLISAVIGDPVLLSREREHVVGRDSTLELRIKSDLVSRRHAKIQFLDGCFRVVDMGSLNGTYVNGYRVDRPCPLLDGDKITVGGFELTLRALKGDNLSLGDGTGGTTRIMYTGKEMAKSLPSASFTGDLTQLGMRDVIEILEWKRQTGTLQITPRRGAPGRLFFADGQIVHAEARRARGEPAAVEVLSTPDGRFSFVQGDLRCQRTIDRDNAALLSAAKL